MYNEVEDLIGFKYNDEVYYYIKNAQNDIIGILDSNYNEVVRYSYDSWGNIISIVDENGNDISSNKNHIGNINPFRYRSYYYDIETNLYYLNSRYYNPIWGRFLNADNYVSTGNGILGHNMYAYCNNNSVNYSDPDGHAVIFGMLALITGVGTLILANTIYQNNKVKKQISNVQKQKAPDKTAEFNVKLQESAESIKTEVSKIPGLNLYDFFQLTKSNSKYDLKRQEEWKQTITYNGMVLEDEDIGNFHFGYIGRAAGFDISTLTIGPGAYQLYEHWNKSVTYINCLTLSVCDDPRDSYYIRLGAIAYDNQN